MSNSLATSDTSSPVNRVRMVLTEIKYQQLMFWRNRSSAIFTIGFASVFLVMLTATVHGHITYLHDVTMAQYYTPGFMAYGVISATFTNLAMITVLRRENGLLKRLRLSPLPGWALISAMISSSMIVAVIESAVLLAIGMLAFGVSLDVSAVAPLAVAVVVGSVAFSSMGLTASTLVSSEDSAGPVINIVFFVFLFLSGVWFPLDPGSVLAKVSNYFPIRRLLLAIFQPFIGHGVDPWAWKDLWVVVIWGIVGVVLAIRRFRWSPWKDDHPTHSSFTLRRRS